MHDQTFALLLVDDDPQSLLLLKDTFRNEDYDIFTAPDGVAALELLGKRRIDASLVDYMMPRMDGLILLGEIKKKYPEIMCIMLTSIGGIEEAVEAIKRGASFVVQGNPILSAPDAPAKMKAFIDAVKAAVS